LDVKYVPLFTLSLIALCVAAGPTPAYARSGPRVRPRPQARPQPRAQVAPKASARQVKRQLQKLRKAALAKRGKTFKLAPFFKAHGLAQDGTECVGTARSLVVSKISPKWKGRTAWTLLLVYKTTMESQSVRVVCMIEARRVKGRLQWAAFLRPGPESKTTLGKVRWERRGRCHLGRIDSRFSHPSESSDIGRTQKRTYYSYSLKDDDPWNEELVTHESEGTVPIIDKRQIGVIKWRRLGTSYFLIHSLTTTRYGGNDGGKVTGKKLSRTVYQLKPTCSFGELSAAQVKAIRRKPGGKKIPLPIAGY